MLLFLLLFLMLVSFRKLLFIVEKGQGLYWVDCARGGLGVHLDAFKIFFFIVEGEGGNGYI